MKAQLAKLRAFLSSPQGSTAIGIVLAVEGLRMVLNALDARMKLLEDGGMIPLDDVATVADLDKIDERVDQRVDARITAANTPAEPAEDGAEA